MSIDWDFLAEQQREAEARGWLCVTGGVIFSPDNTVFVQKRSAHKLLFPGAWDLVGGHAEPGETLQESLHREILEETGWKVKDITHLIQQVDWSSEKAGEEIYRREFDFIVSVEGDLLHPIMESENFSEWRWIRPEDTPILAENRPQNDNFIQKVVEAAFALKKS
jgi:8-oxo-dGTP diphosphatase